MHFSKYFLSIRNKQFACINISVLRERSFILHTGKRLKTDCVPNISLIACEWTHLCAILESRKIHFSPDFTGILCDWQLFKGIRKGSPLKKRKRERREKKTHVGRKSPDSFKCTIPFVSYHIMVNTGCILLSLSALWERRGIKRGENGCTADCKLTSLPK